jgi:hypothetical protein
MCLSHVSSIKKKSFLRLCMKHTRRTKGEVRIFGWPKKVMFILRMNKKQKRRLKSIVRQENFAFLGDGHFLNLMLGLLFPTTTNKLPTQFLLCFLITMRLGLRKSKLALN